MRNVYEKRYGFYSLRRTMENSRKEKRIESSVSVDNDRQDERRSELTLERENISKSLVRQYQHVAQLFETKHSLENSRKRKVDS